MMKRTICMAEVAEIEEPPKAPEVHSSYESEGEITPEEGTETDEGEEQKQTRIARNR